MGLSCALCGAVIRRVFCCCRHGHNEQDEPSATMPLTYRRIAAHPRVLQLYSERLQASGLVTAAEVDSWQSAVQERCGPHRPFQNLMNDPTFDLRVIHSIWFDAGLGVTGLRQSTGRLSPAITGCPQRSGSSPRGKAMRCRCCVAGFSHSSSFITSVHKRLLSRRPPDCGATQLLAASRESGRASSECINAHRT